MNLFLTHLVLFSLCFLMLSCEHQNNRTSSSGGSATPRMVLDSLQISTDYQEKFSPWINQKMPAFQLQDISGRLIPSETLFGHDSITFFCCWTYTCGAGEWEKNKLQEFKRQHPDIRLLLASLDSGYMRNDSVFFPSLYLIKGKFDTLYLGEPSFRPSFINASRLKNTLLIERPITYVVDKKCTIRYMQIGTALDSGEIYEDLYIKLSK